MEGYLQGRGYSLTYSHNKGQRLDDSITFRITHDYPSRGFSATEPVTFIESCGAKHLQRLCEGYISKTQGFK